MSGLQGVVAAGAMPRAPQHAGSTADQLVVTTDPAYLRGHPD
ncbi:MAG: hypothetical protein ACRDRM_02910 [Pseudonocardiaceae bacterium]